MIKIVYNHQNIRSFPGKKQNEALLLTGKVRTKYAAFLANKNRKIWLYLPRLSLLVRIFLHHSVFSM